ncbi:carbohydrate-binding domain-containing protein [Paenibacillus sp. IB182496]|uniref:Carbohydrate-binding domain-containing protein n=1 Tax=Paenibacillus sabuli TaxID=2772509 RepID=A0A927BSH7_9BACL|nr:carbohydrate-binding domain-containing protein [Paenibacillus sabuli]MBD2844870.1 carbohydrate-binding domain-containing protein [Paenibacillus sabuli]
MFKKPIAATMSLALALAFGLPASADDASGKAISIELADNGTLVDGAAASDDPGSAVYVGADIVYYESNQGDDYGEGSAADAHDAEEAAAHTVVTITEPGTYRVSGTLLAGQLAVDLGEDAQSDPSAVVTLILDGVDITSTVAPGVIFYNVYEPYEDDEDTGGVTDLSDAGAQVVLADGSVNRVDGAYVARIYDPGTTKKLHKYDGAFYSKMSMQISGEAEGTGELQIIAANEGLDSELHLTINGGHIAIEAQDDGINTNEDGISVTTMNGGELYVNAGLGAEGDGIDSNGYLTINGGRIVTMANERSPDGGIDADSAITINGGEVIALGTRNDATSDDSKQPFIELSFAATQAAGSTITIEDTNGAVLLEHTADKAFQSLTFSSSELAMNTEYHVFIDGVQQQYTGNSFGMMMGGGFGGPGGMGGEPPEGWTPPEGFEPPAAGEMPEPPEGWTPPEDGEMPQLPDGMEAPEGMQFPGSQGVNDEETGEPSTAFVLTNDVHSFSGVAEASDGTGKTAVTFTVNGGEGIASVASGDAIVLDDIAASADVSEDAVQLTITDVPSEDYAVTWLLSDGADALEEALPTADGTYRLTIAVAAGNETYTGVSEWLFTIGGLPFTDVRADAPYYTAVEELYEAGVMIGTSADRFSPQASVTRATAITVLGRLLGVEQTDTDRFDDVASSSWYSGYVGWAADSGLVIGDGAGAFMPEQTISRADMTLILTRYAELIGQTSAADDASGEQDASSGGRDLTRAELASMLAPLLELPELQ